MLRPAYRAIAPPAGFDEIGRTPARRAKAMPPVPIEQRLAFGERGEMVRLDQAAHRDRAQVRHDEFLARFEHFGGLRLERNRESRRVAAQPEKDDLRRAAERARLRQREQRIASGASVLEDYRVAGDQIGARVLVLRECRERRGIRAPLTRALDRALGVTETRLRAEIGARRHGIAPAGHRGSPGRAGPWGRFLTAAPP